MNLALRRQNFPQANPLALLQLTSGVKYIAIQIQLFEKMLVMSRAGTQGHELACMQMHMRQT